MFPFREPFDTPRRRRRARVYKLERCGPDELQSSQTYAMLQTELAKQMSSTEESADLQLLVVGDA